MAADRKTIRLKTIIGFKLSFASCHGAGDGRVQTFVHSEPDSGISLVQEKSS